MTATLIILITVAVLFLIASCFIMKGEDEVTELPDDKKQSIDKLVDDYIAKSVSGKSKNLKPMIEKEIANKIKSSNDVFEKESKKNFEKLNNKVNVIDQKIEDNICIFTFFLTNFCV